MNSINGLLILTLLFSTLSFAKTSKISNGKVVKIRGNVFTTTDDSSKARNLTKNDTIYIGETIHTKEKSFVKIIANNGITVILGAKTKFIFKGKDPASKIETLQLFKGIIRSVISKSVNKKRKIKVNLKHVSLGIRGTEFIASIYKSGTTELTEVILIEGIIDVDISKFNLAVKNMILYSGEKLNSMLLKEKGLDAVRKVDKNLLDQLIKNKDRLYLDIPAKEEIISKEVTIKNAPMLDIGQFETAEEAKVAYREQFITLGLAHCVKSGEISNDDLNNMGESAQKKVEKCFFKLKSKCSKAKPSKSSKPCKIYGEMNKRLEAIDSIEKAKK